LNKKQKILVFDYRKQGFSWDESRDKALGKESEEDEW
jgi:hypothetical protein